MRAAFSSSIRAAAGAAVMALVLRPAADLLPSIRWNFHLWSRLHAAGRDAPDSGADRFRQHIGAALPASGPIGFTSAIPDNHTDTSRVYTLLQYALAPRQLVQSTDTDFVVVYSPASADAAVLHDARFSVISSPGSGLYVMRRLAR